MYINVVRGEKVTKYSNRLNAQAKCNHPRPTVHAPFPPPPAAVVPRSPSLAPEKNATDHAGSDGDTTYDCDAHQPFLRYLVVDQPAQVRGLQVRRLLFEKQIVVAPRLAIIAQLVVS